MKAKVLIWGIGKEFWQLYNILMLNEAMGNFEITGYISRDRSTRHIGSKEILLPEEISERGIEFEYIIVATDAYYKEICNYGSRELQIERKRFINGKVLRIPYFEWNKYIQIYKNNASIVSESCLGGGIIK